MSTTWTPAMGHNVNKMDPGKPEAVHSGVCQILMPEQETAGTARDMSMLKPAGALLVEDEVFVVLDIEDMLLRGGVGVAATFASNDTALGWLETNRPSVAVVDFRLKDGSSAPLANALRRLGIPTIIYSGNSYEPDVHAADFGTFTWIGKPCDPEVLMSAIHAVMER